MSLFQSRHTRWTTFASQGGNKCSFRPGRTRFWTMAWLTFLSRSHSSSTIEHPPDFFIVAPLFLPFLLLPLPVGLRNPYLVTTQTKTVIKDLKWLFDFGLSRPTYSYSVAYFQALYLQNFYLGLYLYFVLCRILFERTYPSMFCLTLFSLVYYHTSILYRTLL